MITPTNSTANSAASPETDGLVEIKLDGKAIRARPGDNVLEVLVRAGEEISYFCYHRSLSVAASCRQCLVKVGKNPKLVPACQMKVEPGLEISSTSDQVVDARRQMLEFTLVNHPVDCVICDKAGECSLQRHYVDWDAHASQTNHAKVDKPKRVDLGAEVILDAERCILCSRCVRFCAEVAKAPELCFADRGDREVLTTAPGTRLDNPYSLNTVDICPVGALTDKDFRFKSRVWDLYSTRSTCNGCATGCQTEVHHKQGAVYRMVPPKLWDMNLNWMCDEGRRTYKPIAENRLLTTLLGGKEEKPARVIEQLASRLNASLTADVDPIGVVLSAEASNEDNYALSRFAIEVLKARRLYLGDRPDNGKGDDILRSNDPNPNRAGARWCARKDLKSVRDLENDLCSGSLRMLIVVGSALELSEAARAAAGHLDLLVVFSPWRTPLTNVAHAVFPASAWAEVDGTVVNRDGAVLRMRQSVPSPGQARPHWYWIAQLAAQLGQPFGWTTPRQVFDEMKSAVSSLNNASWGKELPTSLLRFAGRRG